MTDEVGGEWGSEVLEEVELREEVVRDEVGALRK